MAAAQLTGNEKREVLAATSVPLPDLNYATSMPCSSHTQHYEEKGFARNVQRSAKYWSRFAPTFRIPDVKLNQLAARPKPCLADKSRAQRVMRSMKNWEADCFSAKFCDADGQLLAAYFSNRVVTQDAPLSPKLAAKAAEHAPEYVGRKRTPSSLGRSLADFEHARQEPQSAPKVVFDGIKVSIIDVEELD
ncbi:hypothetical protein DFH29DRAFT_509642 [Suillus ampliporus]|nr:hypothetical protein DFH29DRAFT_509642 [Suillus ampliporus]